MESMKGGCECRSLGRGCEYGESYVVLLLKLTCRHKSAPVSVEADTPPPRGGYAREVFCCSYDYGSCISGRARSGKRKKNNLNATMLSTPDTNSNPIMANAQKRGNPMLKETERKKFVTYSRETPPSLR